MHGKAPLACLRLCLASLSYVPVARAQPARIQGLGHVGLGRDPQHVDHGRSRPGAGVHLHMHLHMHLHLHLHMRMYLHIHSMSSSRVSIR